MPLAPGTRLGNYEILAPLGKGGMGEVFRARDTKLGREVAVKVLPAAFAANPERLLRFEREAKVLASLNHPNIATIYAVEESTEGKALIMELVPGAPIKGPVSLDAALGYARQIASALEAAHEKGITHRDLKPANIMLTPDGVIKVLDFGLAAVTQPATEEEVEQGATAPTLTLSPTRAGMILGTAPYMSPEQARGQNVDRRTDIWAFGVVLWELLTGKRLFQGADVTETLAAVVMKEPDLTEVPVEVRRLLDGCLKKDPKKRLQAIGDLEYLLDTLPTAAPVTKSRLPWIAAGLAAAAAALVGFVHFREKPPTPQVTQFDIDFPTAFGSFDLSPDGRQLVVRANATADSMLVLRSLDSTEFRRVPSSESSNYPFWSSDSAFIAFSSALKLKVVDMRGAPATTLTDSPNLRPGAWTPDRTLIYASGGTGKYRLWEVPVAGGTPKPVLASELDARFPTMLPDGRHLLFTSILNLEVGGVYLGSRDSKDAEHSSPRKLLADMSMARVVPSASDGAPILLFVRQSTLMGVRLNQRTYELAGDVFPIVEGVAAGGTAGYFLFSASQTGTLAYRAGNGNVNNDRLTWFDRQGKVLGVVGDAAPQTTASLSTDGQQLATSRAVQGNTDIWTFDLNRQANARVTFDPAPDLSPVWSPDGRWIAYTSQRTGVGMGLFRKVVNGTGGEELLTSLPNEGGQAYDWSRDGKYILYAANTGTALRDLFALPVEGDRKPIPIVQSPYRDDQGKFSPDGRLVAYKSNESGRDEVYVQPFPPSGKNERWMVSRNGGTQPRWSRDGKELFYLEGSKLMSASVQLSPVFQAGLPKMLFDAPGVAGGGASVDWDVAPDGKRFLILISPQEVEDRHPLRVIENWQAGLRK